MNNLNENPILESFSDLTKNQKMSIINFVLLSGVCDESENPEELDYLNTYNGLLELNSDETMEYLHQYGQQRIISDLESITRNQKELLVSLVFGMIECDGQPNERELNFVGYIFEELGLNEDEVIKILSKQEAISRYFKF